MELPRALSGSKELMACPRVASTWTVPTGGSPPGAFDWAGKVAAPATQNKRMAIAKCFQDIAHSSFHAADSNREPLKTIADGSTGYEWIPAGCICTGSIARGGRDSRQS